MDKFIDELSGLTYVSMEDMSDKASFLVSVAIMTVLCVVVTTQTYFLNNLNCYLAVYSKGKFQNEYTENYCWVHGTIPSSILMGANGTISEPTTLHDWAKLDKTSRINYYQWVPFVLGLQGVMYYLPRLVWQCLVPCITGNNLEGLIISAKKASNQIGEDRKTSVNDIAECLKDTFFQNEKSTKRSRVKFCQSGNLLFITYFIIKLGYLANSIGQLFLMQKFLGLGGQKLSSNFGWKLLSDINSDQRWQETGMFPRMSYCYIGNLKLVGTRNQYLAQCSLPINMLNEKIYIFLWFWTVGIISLTVASIPLWLWRMCTMKERRVFIKRYLNLDLSIQNNRSVDIGQFVKCFLDNDGVFILRIMSLNAGELVTGDIVVALWNIYRNESISPRLNHDDGVDGNRDDIYHNDDDDDQKKFINMQKYPRASDTNNPVFV